MKLQTNYSDKEVNALVVYIRAIIISMGGLFFGFNNGSFNTTQQHIANMNGWLTDSEQALYIGLITSALPLGCLIGSLLSAKFLQVTSNDYRLCLMVTDIIGLLGITEQILDYNLGHFILGRILSGIAGGLNTSIVPSYLQNFSPLIMRGKTGTFVQTFAQLGAFISLALGAIQPEYEKVPDDANKQEFVQQGIDSLENFEKEGAWRITIGLPIIMCSIRLLCLIFIYTQPTPIQMAQKNQYKSLKKLLKQFYAPERAQKRYQEIIEYAKFTQDQQPTLNEEEIELDEEQQQQQQQQNSQEQQPQKIQSQSNEEESSKQQKEENLAEKNAGNKHIRREQELNGIITQNNGGTVATETYLKDENNSPVTEQNKKTNADRSWKRRLVLGMVVQSASQVSGLNALLFFSKSIFQAQTDDRNVVQTYLFIQGAAGFFFTFWSMFFIEKFGRRHLLLLSTYITLVAQLGIAIFSLLDIFILSFISIIVYYIGFGIGLGGVCWPFTAELVGPKLVSYCSATRWICTLIIGITFRFMVIGISIAGTFFVYFAATLLCLIYFLKEMKETKGLTIEQVDELYAGNQPKPAEA